MGPGTPVAIKSSSGEFCLENLKNIAHLKVEQNKLLIRPYDQTVSFVALNVHKLFLRPGLNVKLHMFFSNEQQH